MKRRTALRIAGVGTAATLAGCIDGVQEHFGLQGNVPIEITNEGEQSYNIVIEAQEIESGRESYDESITVAPDELAVPSHLPQTEQQLRVARIEDDETGLVENARITDESQFINVSIYDDSLDVEIRGPDDEEGNESADGDDNESTNAD